MSNLSPRALQAIGEVDAQLIADFACLDPVYVDGIAGTLNLGETFATLYFRWTPRPTTTARSSSNGHRPSIWCGPKRPSGARKIVG
jgi:hypothetical protein